MHDIYIGIIGRENIWSVAGVKPLIYTTNQWTLRHIFNETHIHSSTHNYNPVKPIILKHIHLEKT